MVQPTLQFCRQLLADNVTPLHGSATYYPGYIVPGSPTLSPACVAAKVVSGTVYFEVVSCDAALLVCCKGEWVPFQKTLQHVVQLCVKSDTGASFMI